jgi:hypothetical protein
MARLVTSVITGQLFGIAPNLGEGLFPVQHAFQSSATAFSVEAKVTNGAIGYLKQEVIVRYALSSLNLTAALAPLALRQSSRYVPLVMGPHSGQIKARMSLLEPAMGTYVYIWAETPTLTTEATLDVSVTEFYTP